MTFAWQEEGCYPGEPIFVAAPHGAREDDGVVLSLVLDATREKSFLLVLDATSLKEIGRAWLPHAVPLGLHGAFFKPGFKDAEEEGFEPPDGCPSSVFETDAFGRSATLPG